MPPAFAYIIDELIHVDYSDENKKVYYDEIIRSIIDSEMGAEFIEALCNLIQNLTIDNLHIIGDIFDRGPQSRYHYGRADEVPRCGYPVGQP